MKVKPDKTIYITLLFLCLVPLVASFLFAVSFAEIAPIICLNVICAFVIVQYAIAFGRSFILISDGIIIQFIFFKKFISWRELEVREFSAKDCFGYKSTVYCGVEITPHKLHRPDLLDPLVFCLFHPINYIFLSFNHRTKPESNKRIYHNPVFYEVDPQQVLELLEQWGYKKSAD